MKGDTPLKYLTVILFESDLEFGKVSDKIIEKFSGLSKEKVLLGVWGKILFNNEEVLSAISGSVNRFLNDVEKTEIIFGCCEKDYSDIITKINTCNCEVRTMRYKDL